MKYDKIWIDTKETFPRRTYRNRMEVMTAGGVLTLSVPVVRQGCNHTPTEEVEVCYHDRWFVNHIRTLQAAYSASPYYLYFKDDIEQLLSQRYDRLVSLNEAVLKWVLKTLSIDAVLLQTSTYQPVGMCDEDRRNIANPRSGIDDSLYKPYYQVFSDRLPFVPNLSIIDLMMNMGREAKDYLNSVRSV